MATGAHVRLTTFTQVKKMDVNPLPWLNWCMCYFFVCQTPEHKCVAFTAFYLWDDAQLRFHRMELNDGRPTWL
jgi:hypothetical protein